MNGETAWALYENRLQRVSAYIHDHLDEELDMERLAGIACLSSYSLAQDLPGDLWGDAGDVPLTDIYMPLA